MYLNLPPANLQITFVNEAINFDACYAPKYRKIFLTICTEDIQIEPCKEYKQLVKLKSNKETFAFLLFHEIGHHWHSQIHRKHWRKFYKNYKFNSDIGLDEYQDQKLEKIADRIACILFKNLYLQQKG